MASPQESLQYPDLDDDISIEDRHSGYAGLVRANNEASERIELTPVEDLSKLPWQDFALCKQIGFEAFYPEGDASVIKQMSTAARRVCMKCTVRQECLAGALDSSEEFGIWGASTPKERERLLKRSGQVVST